MSRYLFQARKYLQPLAAERHKFRVGKKHLQSRPCLLDILPLVASDQHANATVTNDTGDIVVLCVDVKSQIQALWIASNRFCP